MMTRERYTKVDCEIKAVTDNAWLIAVDDEECWIPRSCCMEGHREYERGEQVLLHIATWVCEQKGIET
jgi:hypothetical protein